MTTNSTPNLVFTMQGDSGSLVANFGPYLPLPITTTLQSAIDSLANVDSAVTQATTEATVATNASSAAANSASNAAASAAAASTSAGTSAGSASNSAASAAAASASATTAATQATNAATSANNASASATAAAASVTSIGSSVTTAATSATNAANSATAAAASASSIGNAVANAAASATASANSATAAASSATTAQNAVASLPVLAKVATSGSYLDLSHTPTIPAAQVNSDWNATSGVAQILNKPTIPSAYTLPTASSSVLGGIMVGSGLAVTNGVLSANTGTVTSINLVAGSSNALIVSGGPITTSGSIMVEVNPGNLNLAEMGGLLGASQGGTGISTYTKGGLLCGSSAAQLIELGIGGQGQVLTVGSSGYPVWSNASTGPTIPSQTGNSGMVLSTDGVDLEWVAQNTSNGTVTAVSITSETLTITGGPIYTAGTIEIELGTVSTSQGGTGLTSLGAPGQVLTVNSSGNAFTWTTPGTAQTITINSGHGINFSLSGSTYTPSVQESQLNLGAMSGLLGIANGGTGTTEVGTAGQVLGTDGTQMVWVTPSTGTSLPSVSGNAGDVLSTDGSNLLWITPPTSSGGGNYTAGNALAITDTTVSTSPTTGALTVAGGVGISGNIFLAGNLFAEENVFSVGLIGAASTTDATSTSTGAIVSSGGLGVALDAYIGGTLNTNALVSATAIPVSSGGTGATTAAAALTALLPAQNGKSGDYLTTNGTSASWTALPAYAPLASAALTGTPTAPTASNGTNTTQIATTAFVQSLVSGLVGGLNYIGTWNASTNTPTVTSGTGTKGQMYKVSVAGTTTVDGNASWNVGDMLTFDGTTWDKIDGQATEVISFNTRTGAITLTNTDVTTALGFTPANSTSLSSYAPIASPTFTGTVTIPAGASISGYAPLASPALTGSPTAPTATAGTSTTQVATTAFVTSAISTQAAVTVPTTHGGTGLTSLGTANQVLQVNSGATAAVWSSRPYDIAVYIDGTTTASEVLMFFVATRAFTWPASLTGSYAKASVAATASTTFTILRNGSSVGSFAFAASGTTASFTFSSAITFAVGDTIEITGPATPDTTLANIGITFAGTQ